LVLHGKPPANSVAGRHARSHIKPKPRGRRTAYVLFLIQILAVRSLRDKHANIPLSLVDDEQGELPADWVLQNLHRPEDRWREAKTQHI
jgi:hypothetical protein